MRVLIVVALLFVLSTIALADRCTYSYCAKEELDFCEKSEDRIACNSKGGLFITYREGFVFPSKHRCCTHFTIQNLNDKYLHCVRNIRTRDMKCSTEKSDEYFLKLKTKCNKMTCIKIN